MIRAVAGVLCRTGAPGPGEHDALRRALAAEGDVALRESGALAVAATGGAPAAAGSALCVLAGAVYAGLGAGEGAAAEAELLGAWPGAGAPPPVALRGDFALVLWDGRRGVLARDQMGGGALFWHDDGRRLWFASEVAHLLGALPRRPGPDRRALAHWLAVSGIPAGLTLYEGVARLAGGHLVELDPAAGRARVRRWWAPGRAPRLRGTPDELAAQLRATLETAIARRCTAAPATGVQLSGGLDSASVAGVAATLPPEIRPGRAYSVTFPEHPSVDESELISALSGSLGLHSTRVVVRSGSVLEGALPYLERWQLPPVSPNLFFWLPLLRAAAGDGTRVLIDGEGGDEMFGLSPYLASDRLLALRWRSALALAGRVPGARPEHRRAHMRWYLRTFALQGVPPRIAHAASRALRDPRRHVPAWLGDASARAFVEIADGAAWKREGWPRWRAWLVWATASGMGTAMMHDHVRHRAAMAGIEPRHPLLDPDVLELVLRLPPELAFDPELSRPLLRRAVQGLIPDSVRLRSSKSTFDAIFHASLAGADLPLARGLLGEGARVAEYVDLGLVRRELLDRVPDGRGRGTWALYLWRLVTAECWLRLQEDPAGPRRAAEGLGLASAVWELESPVAG